MFGPIFWKMEHGDPLILFHFLTACAINNRFWQKNWHILFDPKLSRTTLNKVLAVKNGSFSARTFSWCIGIVAFLLIDLAVSWQKLQCWKKGKLSVGCYWRGPDLHTKFCSSSRKVQVPTRSARATGCVKVFPGLVNQLWRSKLGSGNHGNGHVFSSRSPCHRICQLFTVQPLPKVNFLTSFFHRNQFFEWTHFSHVGRKGIEVWFGFERNWIFSFLRSIEKREESHRQRSREMTSQELWRIKETLISCQCQRGRPSSQSFFARGHADTTQAEVIMVLIGGQLFALRLCEHAHAAESPSNRVGLP